MFEHLPGANKVAQDFAKRIKSVQLSNNHEVTDLHTEGSLGYEVLRHLLEKIVRQFGLKPNSRQ